MNYNILSIAGSDSGGGAGIQADIKTATALKTYAATAITCITVQNTQKVYDVLYLSGKIIAAQIAAVLSDIKIDAIKIGMVGNAEIIEAIADILKSKAKNIPIILDPVMVATSGDALLKSDAIDNLKKYLIPLAYLITPNIPEAELLTEMKIKNLADMRIAAQKISRLGIKNILIKGGHLELGLGKIYNLLMQSGVEKVFTNKKLEFGDIHGTGCTLSTAIACNIAKNPDLISAVKKSNRYVYNAIKNGGKIGKGSQVLNHFYL